MRKIVKTSIGFAVNSIFPIISWILWGLLVDKNLSATFSLTYPLQFVWSFLIDIFGYGCYSYVVKDKDSQDDYFQSSLFLGCTVYIVVFLSVIFNFDKYMDFMGFSDEKYLICGIYSVSVMILVGIATLCSLCYSFKDNDKVASNILLGFNTVTYCPLIVTLFLSRDSVLASVVSLVCSVGYVVLVLLKVFKPFKLKTDVVIGIKYSLNGLVSDVGLFIIYVFGIGDLVLDDARLAFTFAIYLQLADWIWDVLGNTVSTIVRLDTAKSRFGMRGTLKNFTKFFMLLMVILTGESVFSILAFDLSVGYFIFMAVLDVGDMIVHIPSMIICNNLSVSQHSKAVACIEILAYVLRISLSFLLPVKIAMYVSQSACGVFKLVCVCIMYILYKRKEKSE